MYKGKGPRKGRNKGNNYGFIGKERLAVRCCATIISVQIFTAEDVMVFHLMKEMPNMGNEANNFSSTSYVYSYTIY